MICTMGIPRDEHSSPVAPDVVELFRYEGKKNCFIRMYV